MADNPAALEEQTAGRAEIQDVMEMLEELIARA
jgi:hypothetical protein